MWIDATVAASFVTDPKAVDSRRQGRLRAGARQGPRQARPTGSGRGRWPFPPAPRRSTPPRSSSPGRPASTTSISSPSKEGWANVPPGTRTSLYNNPEYTQRGAVRRDDAGVDQRGRPEPSDGQAGALYRRPVRRDPRVPGYRRHGRPEVLGGAGRADRASTMR